MKNSALLLCLFFSLTLVGCKYQDRERPMLDYSFLEDTLSFPVSTNNVETIKVTKPDKKKAPISMFIENFYYLPIETIDESLIDYYAKVEFYKGRIYIQDATTNHVSIFNTNGKFINKVGRKGQGPGEFNLLSGFTIDRYHDRLIVYENMRKKLLYFSLDGNFIEEKKSPLQFYGQFGVISNDKLIFQSPQDYFNTHLGELDKYRAIFTDSTLSVLGGAFQYQENTHFPMIYTNMYSNQGEILYQPSYTYDFYQITNDSIFLKYKLDFEELYPIDPQKIISMTNEKDIQKYYFLETTDIVSNLLETNLGLCFKVRVRDHSEEFYVFYDKRSKKMTSFYSNPEFDSDFFFASIISTFNDYFVGIISAESLKHFKRIHIQNKKNMSPEVVKMIDDLDEYDNELLVFFKFKPLK